MNTRRIALLVVSIAMLLGFAAAGRSQQPVPTRLASGFDTIRDETLRGGPDFPGFRRPTRPHVSAAGRRCRYRVDRLGIRQGRIETRGWRELFAAGRLGEYRADRAQSYVAWKRAGSEKAVEISDAIGSYRSDV